MDEKVKEPFIWDNFSDQPYQLKDRNFKKAVRRRELFSSLKTFAVALVTLPLALLLSPFKKKKKIQSNTFFAMSVNLDKEPLLTPALLDELEVEHILVRCKLWEMDKLSELSNFIFTCNRKEVTLNILQDREHIEDLTLLENDLRKIFNTFAKSVARFQIGSTINRAKWGFFSVNEYNRFYKTAYDLKTKEFPNIQLIGSGVIDFEYHFTAHTLFNFAPFLYDGIASLLYVDRRGAPENMQMGFDLTKKIALLSSMVTLSPKTANNIYITETNWPLTGTAPYAPTSEFECVDEESYANFMVRYYLLAFASQQVDAVFWHQLIAPGYGLIDNRDGVRKRTAFYAFATMFKFLKDAEFVRLDIKNKHYTLTCKAKNRSVFVHWSQEKKVVAKQNAAEAYDRDGHKLTCDELTIFESPIYLLMQDGL